jgi:hypothetical protein
MLVAWPGDRVCCECRRRAQLRSAGRRGYFKVSHHRPSGGFTSGLVAVLLQAIDIDGLCRGSVDAVLQTQ